MGWVVHYVGIWVLSLAPSLGSGAIFHQGKIYWAWLCARKCAWCPAVLYFSRPSFSFAIIWQLFSPLDLPIFYSSSSLIADDLSPHLVEKTGVSRRELSVSTNYIYTTTLSLPSSYNEWTAWIPMWGQTLHRILSLIHSTHDFSSLSCTLCTGIISNIIQAPPLILRSLQVPMSLWINSNRNNNNNNNKSSTTNCL